LSETALSIPGKNAYVQGCIREIEKADYGRTTRKPIHDAIVGLAAAANSINSWIDGIGLVVQDGKLCAVYGDTQLVPVVSSSITIPTNIQTALNNILTAVGGSTVRQAIATALGWAYSGTISIDDLGLVVENGLLCYTPDSVIPGSSASVTSVINDITAATYGRETRDAIVKALKTGADYFDLVAKYIEDLGLTAQDGKLCVIYNE